MVIYTQKLSNSLKTTTSALLCVKFKPQKSISDIKNLSN